MGRRNCTCIKEGERWGGALNPANATNQDTHGIVAGLPRYVRGQLNRPRLAKAHRHNHGTPYDNRGTHVCKSEILTRTSVDPIDATMDFTRTMGPT